MARCTGAKYFAVGAEESGKRPDFPDGRQAICKDVMENEMFWGTLLKLRILIL